MSFAHTSQDKSLVLEGVLSQKKYWQLDSRLARGGTYVSIGPGFNVGTTTVIKAIEDIVTGLVSIKNDYVKFPETDAQVVETRETFEVPSHLPNVAGAIDWTHVTIKAPTDSRVDYFS